MPFVGLVTDGRMMVQEALKLRPDVIVADVGNAAFERGWTLHGESENRLLTSSSSFLTMKDDPNLAAAAMELGPIGFVLKHSGRRRTTKGNRPMSYRASRISRPS